MVVTVSNLDELISLRKRERDEEQRAYTLAMAGKADAALGPRVVEAIDPGGTAGWEVNHTSAVRRFAYRGGDYHLVLTAIQGVNRVEVELRHVDLRFAPLAKKAAAADVSEDWFLGALEGLSSQVLDRLTSPRNFA
ncbi:hypothetical protein [Geothrix sp. 21YS21S-2]|uniref:hypothetical protein n=1 Tax=Geothrix sp. 21YS21S-2 TaxID=3068893 RepID=UPI0027B98858|nr:hypothetical protein [Geothrix sp. 21YS21S-2]